MKKWFVYVLLVLFFVVLLKFFLSGYSISYDVKDFKVKEKATSDYIYFEIDYKDNKYNYMFYTGRKILKKRVKDIKVKEVNGFTCLKPNIKGIVSYYVCSDGKELVSYQVANNEDVYVKSDENFKYYDNLNSNEHVYIWKYDGFYYLNGKEMKSINIFNKDRYSNDLMIKVNNYLVFPKYDNNYMFRDFVVLNMSSGKYEFIESKYDIHYDSYIVGNRKSSLYLFDNKDEKLYEINYKKRVVDLVGDREKGFIKYVDGKIRDGDINEYVKDKITYFEEEDKLYTVDNNYLVYELNKDLKLKYYSETDIKYIDAINENLYFLYKDKIFKYSNSKVFPVFHYFEFNFNNKNSVFVYND